MQTRIVRLTIKGQQYIARFQSENATLGPHWVIHRFEQQSDNLRGVYTVRVDDRGRPRQCSCPDCFHRSKADLGEIKFCKHLIALDNIWLMEHPEIFAPNTEVAR